MYNFYTIKDIVNKVNLTAIKKDLIAVFITLKH